MSTGRRKTVEIQHQNGPLHLSNDKNPREGSTKGKVEHERLITICTNGCIIHNHKDEFVWWVSAVSMRRRNDGYFVSLSMRKHVLV